MVARGRSWCFVVGCGGLWVARGGSYVVLDLTALLAFCVPV